MSVFVTGATYGEKEVLEYRLRCATWPFSNFPVQDDAVKALAEKEKNNYLIIMGDFGYVSDWDGYIDCKKLHPYSCLKALDEAGWTTLFIGGKHDELVDIFSDDDSMDTLAFGGPTLRISDNIYWLKKKGHVYSVDGLKIWCFGGCSESLPEILWQNDLCIMYHNLHQPNEDEYTYGIDQLSVNGWSVDYVVTDEAPTEAMDCVQGKMKMLLDFRKDKVYGYNAMPAYLQFISQKLICKHWYAAINQTVEDMSIVNISAMKTEHVYSFPNDKVLELKN